MVFVCPTCQREFNTRRGLGVHHSRVHGERLPNRTCANCGEVFYEEYAKKCWSKACLREGVTFEGEKNPNFRGGKDSTECEICGTTFDYYPSEKVGRYCPPFVENESWRTPPLISGSEHPRWSGGKIQRACVICGDKVERYPSGFVSDVVLCSEPCRRLWLSEAFTGEGHPNWKGGGNEAYGSGWNLLRKKALERDDHECVVCGKTCEEIGRNPDVHHIVPVRWFVESGEHEREDAHELENVVSLCVECHRRADSGKISVPTLRELIDTTE